MTNLLMRNVHRAGGERMIYMKVVNETTVTRRAWHPVHIVAPANWQDLTAFPMFLAMPPQRNVAQGYLKWTIGRWLAIFRFDEAGRRFSDALLSTSRTQGAVSRSDITAADTKRLWVPPKVRWRTWLQDVCCHYLLSFAGENT
jgi:hypothetical protein